MAGAVRSSRRRSAVLALAIAIGLAGAVARPASSWAGFSAQEDNSGNVFSAGTLQLEGETPAACYSTGSGRGGTVGANVGQCTGSAIPSGQLTTGSVLSATTTLANVGTAPPSAATLSLLSCGAAAVADSSSTGNTGLVYGGVTYGTSFTSPVESSFTASGITVSGATGTYVGTTVSLLSPVSFTLVAWVKTTSSDGGGIIGFSNVQPDAHWSTADRMLWVEPSGVVAFGVQTRETDQEVQSTTAVNNGGWHFVAGTVSGSTMSLDVDGSVTSASFSFPLSYTGYWHLGWAGNTGWSNAGSDEYLAGSLFGVGVFGPLTSADLTELDDATSASGYESTVSGFDPSGAWMLSDSGTVPFTGGIPVLGSTTLCQEVLADVQASQGTATTCVYPAGAGACAATPPSSAALSSLGTQTMAAVTATQPVTVVVRMTLATASPAGVVGLHLLADLGFAVTSSGWSAEVSYPNASLET